MTLDEYLESRRLAVFSYGSNDCGKFCAGWLLECGVELPFDWADEDEAQALIAAHGSIEAAVSAVLEPIPVNHALKGDIMQAKDDSLGICVGAKAATPTEGGMRLLPREYYVRAWRCHKQQ